jgi:hypothetical protein
MKKYQKIQLIGGSLVIIFFFVCLLVEGHYFGDYNWQVAVIGILMEIIGMMLLCEPIPTYRQLRSCLRGF